MAVCLECSQPMSQTEAICPKCGEDFVEPTQSPWEVLLHPSKLTDLFRLVSVAAVFCVGLTTVLPTLSTPIGPIVFGILCGISAELLGDSAPLWSRVLSVAGLVGILFYPLMAVWFLGSWILSWLI